jgi:hypothetical protein
VNRENENVRYERFEGRTPDGMDVHLLNRVNAESNFFDSELFGKAAWSVAKESAPDAGAILVLDGCAVVPNLKNYSPLTVAVIQNRLSGQPDLSGFDRVVIHGEKTAQKLLKLHHPHLTIFPVAIPDRPVVKQRDKSSAKATLQFDYGLPVIPDIPLIFADFSLTDDDIDTIASILTQNVQLVIQAENSNDGLNELAEKYRDRLLIAPASVSSESLIACSDFSIIRDGLQKASIAASMGTVPIVHEDAAEWIITLEPSLQSGSGIIFGPETGMSAEQAVSVAIGYYFNTKEFLKLAARIPGYTTSWEKTAKDYNQLIADYSFQSAIR